MLNLKISSNQVTNLIFNYCLVKIVFLKIITLMTKVIYLNDLLQLFIKI